MPTVSPESLALSKALKKRGFAHVGPTTMYALMEAIGIVDDHLVGCHRRGRRDSALAEPAPVRSRGSGGRLDFSVSRRRCVSFCVGDSPAPLAQSAERLHGKEKVYGSIP